MDFLYNLFQTSNRSKYFKGIFAIYRSSYSLYNFKGSAIDRSKFSKELHDRSNLKAIIVQFLENDRLVQIFKGIGRSVHLNASMVGKVAIDWFKFSKELGDQSTLNAITVGKVAIDHKI